jgi:hypothetical protein
MNVPVSPGFNMASDKFLWLITILINSVQNSVHFNSKLFILIEFIL